MTQMENAAIQQQRKSISQKRKLAPKIDMTPMGDLGFLLITFFVFTTTMSKPMAADLYMPKDERITDSMNIPESLVLTILLDENNKIYYYKEDWQKAKIKNAIYETNYSTWKGLGNVIREKQKEIDEIGKFPEGKRGMMLLIKPLSKSVYKNVIDALDEVMINDVKKYAIVEPVADEIAYVKSL